MAAKAALERYALMATILVQHLRFNYASPFAQIFDDLTVSIDTEWRTALVGRNGRGKTTLLRLIAGELTPTGGALSVPVATGYISFPPARAEGTTIEVIRDVIAPFRRWEEKMEELLTIEDEASLAAYGDLLELYEAHRGYEIDGLIEREAAAIGLGPESLMRRFETLSGGEQTRAMIAALFLRPAIYPIIDEPTNHLDADGRETLARYLERKHGFLLVSHDRSVLDRCADHIVSINRSDVRVTKGSYGDWKRQKELEEEHERRRDENLRRQVEALEETARARRSWSASRERGKNAAADSGYEGHKAAKMMKRALHVERRIEEMIEEKKGLMSNAESLPLLRLAPGSGSPEVVLSVHDLSVDIDGRRIVHDVSFVLRRGERLAIVGPNGSGKTTLMRAITGEIRRSAGLVHLPNFVRRARSYQNPLWEEGYLRDHLRAAGLAETEFRRVMGSFGVRGDIFDRPLESFSRGEQKKVDLCRSFASQFHLLLWDEPMNYIDLMSRERIEEAILADGPTMLFIEHDRRFVENIATRVIDLGTIDDGRGSRMNGGDGPYISQVHSNETV